MTDSRKDTGRVCKIPDCNTDMKRGANGFCHKHNYRWKKYGDPLAGGPAPGSVVVWFNRFCEDYTATDQCLFWPHGKNGSGYGIVNFSSGPTLVHREICKRFHGAPPDGAVAAHSCGQGHLACMNPAHLRWATPKANSEDRSTHGRTIMGEGIPWAKLNADAVRSIRLSNRSLSELAKVYGVHVSSIHAVKQNRAWRHVR